MNNQVTLATVVSLTVGAGIGAAVSTNINQPNPTKPVVSVYTDENIPNKSTIRVDQDLLILTKAALSEPEETDPADNKKGVPIRWSLTKDAKSAGWRFDKTAGITFQSPTSNAASQGGFVLSEPKGQIERCKIESSGDQFRCLVIDKTQGPAYLYFKYAIKLCNISDAECSKPLIYDPFVGK